MPNGGASLLVQMPQGRASKKVQLDDQPVEQESNDLSICLSIPPLRADLWQMPHCGEGEVTECLRNAQGVGDGMHMLGIEHAIS